MFNVHDSSKAFHTVLLKDNYAACGKIDGNLELNLSHLKVVFLPLNTTSLVHLSDCTVIAALKCCNRHLQVGHVPDLEDFGKNDIYKVDLLQGLLWKSSMDDIAVSGYWKLLASYVSSICNQ